MSPTCGDVAYVYQRCLHMHTTCRLSPPAGSFGRSQCASVPATLLALGRYLEGRRPMAEDYARKRLLAIDVLLEEPEEISDGLEAELYALRDRLHLIALGRS